MRESSPPSKAADQIADDLETAAAEMERVARILRDAVRILRKDPRKE